MNNGKLHISKISVSNILGIKQLTFDAYGFNEITGSNGEGKTSILEALKSVFQGGNDVTLIRNGAAKGEVGIELSDGTNIVKTFSDKADLKVTDPAGGKVKNPATFISQLTDLISVNPVNFLTADKKNRTNILLETLNLKLDKKDLEGIEPKYYQDINLGFVHALEAISKIHKSIFDERTGTNRLIKDKDSTIKELQEGLNEMSFDPSKDYEAEITALENTKSMMEAKMRSYTVEFDDCKNKELEEIRNYKSAAITKAESDFQEALANIQKIRDEHIQEINLIYDNNKDIILKNDAEKRNERQEAFNQKYNPLLEQIAMLKEKQKHFAGYQKQNELINRTIVQREEQSDKANSLNEQLAILENVKLSLLQGLPISGLEVIDGQIYRHGVIFDRLNTAQKVEIAVEIAKLRAGDLGLVCVDNLELFDSETFQTFKENAVKCNLQLFVTKVGDGSLKINGQPIN